MSLFGAHITRRCRPDYVPVWRHVKCKVKNCSGLVAKKKIDLMITYLDFDPLESERKLVLKFCGFWLQVRGETTK